MGVDKTRLPYISSDKKIITENHQKKPSFLYDHRQCAIIFITLTLSLAIIFAVATITLHMSIAKNDFLIFPHYEYDSEEQNPTKPHLFVSRAGWGGKPPLNQTKLHHPLDLVILAHSVTPYCLTFTECSRIVASIQNYHLSRGMPDIAYNFLIGGDGNIYVGRGWDVENQERNQSIIVTFIGNFLVDYLDVDMTDALQELLHEGVELGKLQGDYKIVCHNQTKATLSPGVNVYSVVKRWEHFQPGSVK